MDNVLLFFESITILSVVKLLLVVLLLVYAIFAGLMMRQIAAMTKAVTMKDDFIIRGLGLLHFVVSALILLMAIFIL